tara:strand:+ start:326 stop:1168 length:843 start_codon:yes stop_codon:yes gene_type:complete
MSEETLTTESTDNLATEQNSASVLGSSTVGDNQNDDWKSTLPDDLQNDPTLQNFKDVESLAKTVVHQQKVLGNRVPIPKTDEEKTELYTKLGRPDDPTKYEVKIPETHASYFNETSVDNFKNVAHQIGLNNEQVNALIDYQVNEVNNQQGLVDSQVSAEKQVIEKTLRQEWGYDYDKNIRAATKAVQVYGDESLNELLQSNVGNHPGLIKLFARLGADVTEDMAQNTTNNTLSVSPLDAKAEIERIMGDNNHPYFDANHKDHKSAIEQMRQLHEKVYGNK